MKCGGQWRRALEVDGHTVRVLDQQRLPYAIEFVTLDTLDDAVRAIRDMTVRGAPLIGVTAAYGVALALAADRDALATATARLAQTRPTAVNLQWALDDLTQTLATVAPGDRADAAFHRAGVIYQEEIARCEAIGGHGLAVIRERARRGRATNILTHCNAGWLATGDWGTALAPIYRAHDEGVAVHVWVDETRPRNQGLLTAWELAQHGIPHTVIADNAGGHLMARGAVDLCIVGTDRTTRTGDVCNKIGTYLKALAAHDAGVPFYVAVPSPSIDWTLTDGTAIPIEERTSDELRWVTGRTADGTVTSVELIASASAVANPAFDVTPARLITALITERGAVAPSGLATLFERA